MSTEIIKECQINPSSIKNFNVPLNLGCLTHFFASKISVVDEEKLTQNVGCQWLRKLMKMGKRS